MAPNARVPILQVDDSAATDPTRDALVEMLDKKADTDGLSNVNADNEDWTDVKHSERKKRDRLLDDGVLIGLMKKSDYKGFERLFINLSIMAATVFAIHRMNVSFDAIRGLDFANVEWAKLALFVPTYFFYGFQFQCFAFAGQHEFLHRNAWKTRWINDVVLFFTGVFCFELGAHERVMHKQHHTFTNNIDRDPELTSFYTREELENPGFRNIPFTRMGYLRGFLDVFFTLKCRAGRMIFSAIGVPVDYSGTGWSLSEWTYNKESGIMRELQMAAIAQLSIYAGVAMTIAQTPQGRASLLFWWIAPVICGYPVVNYFRNLEHADCEVSKEPNCLRNTRSVRSNIIIRTLLWDTNYHAEHHCYPMVPFFNLHKLNELMYDHVIHNEKDHFTTQNWAAFKPGGWIDEQARDMELYQKSQNNKAKAE
mmetsp:Transcript_26987/g.62103  ORF Transcript_26987/g.62103 Transcript_26987/m.62103 type:complete len:424 (-) Transcript_26987:200-1471(-)